jgi:hypothetical protein
MAGVVTADQVKMARGKLLDIWPDSIAPKCSNIARDELGAAPQTESQRGKVSKMDAKAVNEIMINNRNSDENIESKIRELIKCTFKGSELAAALDWLDRRAVGPR